jgi:hypothetical protein
VTGVQTCALPIWYSWFVAKPNFDASRVACWALSSSGAAGQTVPPGAIGGVHDHASVGEEDRRAGRGGDGNREAAGTATLEYRVVAAREKTFPGKWQPVGAEAREVR